jgi:regulator of sirC expression with transglutaminase-like and TPR domain
MTATPDKAPEQDAGDDRAGERLLRDIGTAAAEGPIALGEAALALAARDRPRVDTARYRHHLALLARDVGRAGAAARDVGDRVAALNEVIFGVYSYAGDTLTYDDLQNANLMRVIDRRKGLPVALGILYIATSRAQSWQASGLGFPGHFLVRLDHEGERVIVDPFHAGAIRSTAELREMLKGSAGGAAELDPEHYAPVGDRQVLLRLQNNIKLRLVQSQQLDKALAIVEGMLLFAPDHAALWREAGLLHAHLDNYRAAIAALEEFLRRDSGDAARHSTATLLQQLKARLN